MKKQLLKSALIAVAGVGLLAGNTLAAPLSPTDHNDAGPDLYQAVNHLISTAYTDNDNITSRQTNFDQVWTDMVQFENEPWAIIGVSASYNNSFGTYTDIGTGSNKLTLANALTGFGFTGDGSNANPYIGDKQVISTASPFGFFLNTNQGTEFFSEIALNVDGLDHMTTYALPEMLGQVIWTKNQSEATPESWTVKGTAYLIGWEDISGGGDGDYDDMMFFVSKIQPVPEPTTMLLFGTGLVGLAGLAKRKRS